MLAAKIYDYPSKQAKAQRVRILLDTNIWRYVVDEKAQGTLLGLARQSCYSVQIAPSVLYETFRLKDERLRSELIHLMTNARFERLMPEAYSESIEILEQIEQLRPDWIRKNPDVEAATRLLKDWTRKTGGFWVRCARQSSTEARRIQLLEGSMIEDALGQAHTARKEMMEGGWKRNPPMNLTLGAFSKQIPGWNGQAVEPWKIDAMTALGRHLQQSGDAYRDWILPLVDIDSGLLFSPAWTEFWLHLVRAEALPRQWLRWAHSFAQRFRKVGSGSVADTQLFTYLLDTDIVITGDKAFTEILEECRNYAPCTLPKAQLVPAGSEGVLALFRLLRSNL